MICQSSASIPLLTVGNGSFGSTIPILKELPRQNEKVHFELEILKLKSFSGTECKLNLQAQKFLTNLTQAKRNFATHSDLSIEMKDI